MNDVGVKIIEEKKATLEVCECMLLLLINKINILLLGTVFTIDGIQLYNFSDPSEELWTGHHYLILFK